MRQLLTNGNIYVEAGVFADSMLIEADAIVAVGTYEEVCEHLGHAGDLSVFDLEGRTVVPGFNDSHLHLSHLGAGLNRVQLSGAHSVEACIHRGRSFLASHPDVTVLVGEAWNQDYFTTGEKRSLDRHDLDQITTEIPVLFTRVCGHIVSMNTCALERLAIAADTVIEGGTIVLENAAQPSGEVRENAIYTAYQLLPEKSEETLEEEFLRAAEHAIESGITSVQSCDANGSDYAKTMHRIERIYRAGRTKLRYGHQFHLMHLETFEDYLAHRDAFQCDEHTLSRGALKLFKDGSLGGRTALLREDYADDPGNKGVSAISQEKLNAFLSRAQEAGVRVIVHAIGDGAIESVVDAIENVTAGAGNALGHGIVHCQITDHALLTRIAALDIRLMVQPIFLEYDITIASDRVGATLAASSYAFRTMIEQNAKNVSFGTDCPVEDLSPIDNIAAAVTRTRQSGDVKESFYPAECVTVAQAIDAYTINSAYNEGKADWKGRLKPGYVADLVVLSEDIFAAAPSEIRSIQVEQTMIGGTWVYDKNGCTVPFCTEPWKSNQYITLP